MAVKKAGQIGSEQSQKQTGILKCQKIFLETLVTACILGKVQSVLQKTRQPLERPNLLTSKATTKTTEEIQYRMPEYD